MGTEDCVLKGTKLITNTKKQKLKIQCRVWNFRNTMLKKRRRKSKREEKSHKNYFKIYRYKIDNKYQNEKIKNLEQSLEFQKYNVKKKKKRRRKIKRENKQTNKNNVTKIIKKIQVQN